MVSDKMFLSNHLEKKNKVKFFFLKKIMKAGLIFNKEENRKVNIQKLRTYLKEKKDNIAIQDFLAYNLEMYKKKKSSFY